MSRDVLLFDLDGTLTDSGPGIMHAAQTALDSFGITGLSEQALRQFVGRRWSSRLPSISRRRRFRRPSIVSGRITARRAGSKTSRIPACGNACERCGGGKAGVTSPRPS